MKRDLLTVSLALSLVLALNPGVTRVVHAPWAPPIQNEESDVDGNGVVNILDVATAAVAFGKGCILAPCPVGWDTRADINNDGVINILDVAQIAFYFGSVCGAPALGWNSNADINNDNVVTPLDTAIFMAAFPSALGRAAWNPEADMNGDGVVNILDAGIFGLAAGSFC